jgi:hypothetical protein
MTETINVMVRMRDVGIALLAAGEYGEALNRLRLQKFIYLLDQIGQLLRLLPPMAGHYSFRNGPFDPRIQNAVDALAFRGIVKISGLHKTIDGAIHCEYSLSSAGKKWADRMIHAPTIVDRWRAAQLISIELNNLGWERLRELVYAEPAYLAARPDGYGQNLRQLEFTNPSSAAIFRAISHALTSGLPRQPTLNVVVHLYFEYLSRYAASESRFAS